MIDFSLYENKSICIAVSGGKDSMALLHCFIAGAKAHAITLSAANCDHKMRGEISARDSQFVRRYCEDNGVPLIFFEWETEDDRTETAARIWRISCYARALTPHTLADGTNWKGADAIATAHHLSDNAETVLFNLARGSALSGLTGITDCAFTAADGSARTIIRPLISCTREQIDAYIAENGVPYVQDESNFTDDYTRNYIRRHVLPELEKAVSGAAKSIYRFSRLAEDDEEYFSRLIAERGLIKEAPLGKEILHCDEKVIFKRAVVQVLTANGVKDYTSEHLRRLYGLQFAEIGKKFEFLGFTAYKEEGRIAICADGLQEVFACQFSKYLSGNHGDFADRKLSFGEKAELSGFACPKVLKFDLNAIPDGAEIRFMREGDRFTKFGGGTKGLGDYFTDKKIPVRIRARVPVVAAGNEILIVCGVEISDKVKVTAATQNVCFCIAEDYVKLSK